MKPTLLAVACALLVGCIEPPPPTKTVTRAVALAANGCPENVAPIAVEHNDKVSWTLAKTSSGYPTVEAFGVAFDEYNPTYCVNDASVAKQGDITCTIKVDAKRETICYTVSTVANGGSERCERRFLLRVGNSEAHSCDLP